MQLRLTPRRIGIAATAFALLLAAAYLFGQDTLFRMAIHPAGRYDAAAVPPRPDYASPHAWALRPANLPAGAWETPWGVDVFYIHPTTAYAGDAWNAAIDDAESYVVLEHDILANHAAPFQHAGPVYAPRYRQAALWAEIHPGAEAEKAYALAYDDILRAFDAYLAEDNRGRAIIVAGMGQGGVHALRLLRDRFQQGELKQRLAAAYIIDAALPASFPRRDLEQTVCHSHADIHCIVAWSGVIAGDGEARRRFQKTAPVWTKENRIVPVAGTPTVCVNPLSWSTSSVLAPRTDHKGAAKASGIAAGDPEIIPRTVSGRCLDGVMVIDPPAIPDFRRVAGWGGRYKSPDYNLFFADIAFNAAERSRAAGVWLDEHAKKPAKPLPPSRALPDAPIHRPDGKIDPVR